MLVLFSLSGLGCGGVQSPAPTPPSHGPLVLSRLVPLESRFVLVTRPAELFADSALARVLGAILPSEQLERFAQRSGVDPRALSELVFAEHPEGRVILARGTIDATFAVREAGERMAPLEALVDEPFVRRVGFLGPRRVDLSALSSNVIAWVEGPPQLAADVLVAVGGEPSEGPPSEGPPSPERLRLEGSTAFHEAIAAPLACFALEPLGLPLDTGVGLLLARQRTLVAWARSTEAGTLQMAVELEGEFPEGAGENFRTLARSIAESDLGAALGMLDAMPTLRIEAESHRVRIIADFDPDTLALGLRTLLHAELRELLDEDERSPGGRTEPGSTSERSPQQPEIKRYSRRSQD